MGAYEFLLTSAIRVREAQYVSRTAIRPEDGMAHGYESCFCKHNRVGVFLHSTERPGGAWTSCATGCVGLCGASGANFAMCLPVATRTGRVGGGIVPPPMMKRETYNSPDKFYACVCRSQDAANPISFVYGIEEVPKGTYTWGR